MPAPLQVIFEAARAICNLRDVSARELAPAITVLQVGRTGRGGARPNGGHGMRLACATQLEALCAS